MEERAEPSKADMPILVMVFGIVIDVSDKVMENA